MSAPVATAGRISASKERLRLWISLLRATRAIEARLRERLRNEFDTTLPRFDVMAALHRAPDGMGMSDLSKFLLVSNGNATVVVDRLVQDGFVVRAARDGDRRTSVVRLTKAGTRAFEAMASAHEMWVDGMLRSVSGTQARELAETLGQFVRDRER